ncbi:MAG TPA: VOC family protein [Pyrinomonadaceae bacterium]|nr:VOC family protein [Pyrinomonadaceae bacterium]
MQTQRVHGIGAVMIYAREPEKLAQWYADHLGIVTELDESDGNYYGGVENEKNSFRFGIYPGKLNAETDRPIMVNYKVTSLEKIKGQLVNEGVPIEQELEMHGGRFLYLRDPEGNPIELWETSS